MSDKNVGAPLPPLKAGIEAIEIEHEGQPMVLFRDQEGINDTPVAVTLPGFVVAMLLNGTNTATDVQSQFSKTTGGLIQENEIMSLVQQLDKADLLETPGLQARRKKVWEDFKNSSVREAFMMGSGYPDQPLELAAFLGRFFKDPKGPQKEVAASDSKPAPLALVAPHIDLHRGGPAYAWAYQALGECAPPDLIVALGVAHMSPNSPWAMTKKDYETPYGPMKVDLPTFEALQKVLWYDVTVDEWVHRREHSLEFQALWLKYLWRDKTPPWVPILCSTFERFSPDRAPSSIETVNRAIDDMAAVLLKIAEGGKRVMVLAGVDFAHVGPRFGDELELNADLEQRIEKEDRQSLDHALKLDADPFYTSVIADGHWRKVCGLSATYTSLRLVKALAGTQKVEGKLLTYGQAPDPAGGIVSFASAIYR